MRDHGPPDDHAQFSSGLFLDEFAEFIAPVLDGLRQPLEEGVVGASRAKAMVSYPAKVLRLVAAMNPCPRAGESVAPGGGQRQVRAWPTF